FFFFSSRRRHTRWPRDWSSDVCSSDLLSTIDIPDTESFTATITAIDCAARQRPVGWVISLLQPTAKTKTKKARRMNPPRDWEQSGLAGRHWEVPRRDRCRHFGQWVRGVPNMHRSTWCGRLTDGA